MILETLWAVLAILLTANQYYRACIISNRIR